MTGGLLAEHAIADQQRWRPRRAVEGTTAVKAASVELSSVGMASDLGSSAAWRRTTTRALEDQMILGAAPGSRG
jgi:hypothetical protein